MKKRETVVNLSIPTPCHEKWSEMSPIEKGRFCNQCAKTVIDFTQASDTEIIQTIQQTESKVCGRFLNSQMNRPILQYPERSLNNYFPLTHILVGLFLFSSPTLVFTQSNSSVETEKQVILKGEVVYSEKNTDAFLKTIKGQLVDTFLNEVISFKTVYLKASSDSIIYRTMADKNGYFKFELPNDFNEEFISLIVETHGEFEQQTITINTTKDLPWTQTIYLQPALIEHTMGMVIIDEKEIRKMKRNEHKSK